MPQKISEGKLSDNYIPYNGFWVFFLRIQQKQYRSTAGYVITQRVGFSLLCHLLKNAFSRVVKYCIRDLHASSQPYG